MPKLTKQFIEQIQSQPTGQCFFRDDELPGFAVRVTQRTKSYIVERRIDGVNRRITIARCGEISLDAARKQAQIMLADMTQGKDPKTGKQINPHSGITLREVLEKFLAVKPIRKCTQKNYILKINAYFKDWLDLPLTSITKDMVELRHHELTVAPNRLGTSGHGRANDALKKLSTLISFAADRYGTDDEPLIKTNPVTRLTRNKAWHRINPRQGIVPDNKLADWYRAVSSLPTPVARDFLLFLLLTGMRLGETKQLQWSHVDFDQRIIVVPRELTKSDRELRLPLSHFLVELLEQRYRYCVQSQWVFKSPRAGKHLSESSYAVRAVRAKCGVYFTFHDLRRTFLTMAAKLDVPSYALKRLVNHSVANDMTSRYIVLDMERLRLHMQRITDAFLDLLGANIGDLSEWKRIEAAEFADGRQILIPFDGASR